MRSVLSDKHFHNEEAAYAFVEARLWPNGPICPHCGGTDRISKMGGKSTRIGTYKCYQCRKPFTVKVGTFFESSHVPMRHWLQAIFLMSSSKNGISSHQLHRTLVAPSRLRGFSPIASVRLCARPAAVPWAAMAISSRPTKSSSVESRGNPSAMLMGSQERRVDPCALEGAVGKRLTYRTTGN